MTSDRTKRIETINLARLGFLLSNKSATNFMEQSQKHTSDKGGIRQHMNVVEHCKKLYMKCKPDPNVRSPFGTLESTFFQPHGKGFGRLNAKENMSLQVTCRSVRHAIACETYIDIDIVNCHPNILHQYCIHNNIPCSALENFVNNRDEIFAEIIQKNPGMNRDSVKHAVLSLLNGGTKDYKAIQNKPFVISQFAENCNFILENVSNKNKEIQKQVINAIKKKGEQLYNIHGKVMSRILQSIENQMLECIESICVQEGWHLQEIIPVHDGAMIPRRNNISIPDLLKKCQEEIYNQLGYHVSLVEKPMNYHESFMADMKWPEEFQSYKYLYNSIDNIAVIRPKLTYNANTYMNDVKDYMRHLNKLELDLDEYAKKFIPKLQMVYAYIIDLNCHCIRSSEHKRYNLQNSIPLARIDYVTRTEDGEIKSHLQMSLSQFISAYTNHLPSYDFIDYEPFGPEEDAPDDHRMLNTYEGFQATLLPEEDIDMKLIEPIIAHFVQVWCDNDQELYSFLFGGYFRSLFKEPGKKTGTALNLVSKQGSGKNTVIDDFLIPYVFGTRQACVVVGIGKLVQRFNTLMEGKLFLSCNEMPRVDSNFSKSDAFDTLKAIITDKRCTVEPKGLPCYNINNCVRLIISTNQEFSLRIEVGDRRYVVLQCSEKYIGNFQYFESLVTHFNQRTADHFYSFCYYNKGCENPRKTPMTKLKQEVILSSSSNPIRFLFRLKDILEGNDLVAEGKYDPLSLIDRIRIDYKDLELDQFIIPRDRLFMYYKLFCAEENEKPCASNWFGRKIVDHIDVIFQNQHRRYDLKTIKM